MILQNQYPICEFDTSKNPIIHPANFWRRVFLKNVLLPFLEKNWNSLFAQNNLPVIGYLNSEVLDIPIYEYVYGEDRLCITMAFCGAPGAAVTLEELHAMGCEKFIICGGAGGIDKRQQSWRDYHPLFLRSGMRGHPIII